MLDPDACVAVVKALEMPALGAVDVPIETQVQLARMISRNAAQHGSLCETVSTYAHELEELAQREEALRLTIADARRILEQAKL